MCSAYVAQYVLQLTHARDLIARLRASDALRWVCGFDTVPSESTFSRFFARLAQHQDLVNQAFIAATDSINGALMELRDAGELPPSTPAPGRAVAVDSSDIPAYANSRRGVTVDPNAAWGHRTPKNGAKPIKGDGELFYGYKLHALCDAVNGHPLSWDLRPANDNYSPQLPHLLDRLDDRYPYLHTRYLMADRGCDSLANYRHLGGQRIWSVIMMRNTDQDELYSVSGRPLCLGNQEMEYVCTDRGQGHLFH